MEERMEYLTKLAADIGGDGGVPSDEDVAEVVQYFDFTPSEQVDSIIRQGLDDTGWYLHAAEGVTNDPARVADYIGTPAPGQARAAAEQLAEEYRERAAEILTGMLGKVRALML